MLLIVSLFFTVIYLIRRESKNQLLWAGYIGSMSWIILGLVFFVGRAIQGLQTYVVGLLFNGFGIIFLMLTIIDQLNLGKWKRELGEVET